MTNWSDAAKNGIVVIVCCIVISMVMGIVFIVNSSSEKEEERLYATMTKVQNDYYRAYDGTTVSGQKVIGAIQQFSRTDTAVLISPLDTTEAHIYTRSIQRSYGANIDKIIADSEIADARFVLTPANNENLITSKDLTVDIKNTATYVNPAGKFEAKLIHDANGTIIAIYFKQIPNNQS
jgi:hypothetical protein